MSPDAHDLRALALSGQVLLALFALAGCSGIGDLGVLRPSLIRDDMHGWVGRDAARAAGAPVSANEFTDDERELRDLAFPLIEPPYDRQRWESVIYEYGLDHTFRRDLWIDDHTAYYAHLSSVRVRSVAARYSQLTDDIRNDIVRIAPFFAVARRVIDFDRRREASMQHVADLAEPEVINAQARVGENSLTVAWVQHSLTARCASYRFALEHLAAATPEAAAADADRLLAQLQQQIAANTLVQAPQFAPVPIAVRSREDLLDR